MENHNEYKYILELENKKVFVRIVSDYNDLVYDIIIYSINDDNDFNKYKRIFFPNILTLSDDIKNMGYPVLYVDDKINLVYNEKLFTLRIGYEDWDYKNKCLNNLCNSIEDLNPLSDFNKTDFKKTYTFIKNGGEKIKLDLNIKYVDGFYLIVD
nr:hypothetical protein [Acholeplasmatales bacterium]